MKGAWSGEREEGRRCEVIGVWSFLLTPVFLLCQPLDFSQAAMSFHMVEKPEESLPFINFQICGAYKSVQNVL